MKALLDLPSVRTPNRDALERGLALYGDGAKLPDAYIVALAEAASVPIASFDGGLDRIGGGARRFEP